MCGRFVRIARTSEIVDIFGVDQNLVDRELQPSYNVAPSHLIPVISQGRVRKLHLASWGFSAAWKGTNAVVINARAETVFVKQTFRHHTTQERCVIPMSGYYEWLTNETTKTRLGAGKRKIPYFIHATDGSPVNHGSMLAAAGLVRVFNDKPQCVMLTTAANGSVRSIHDRMPVLLGSGGIDEWLSESGVPLMDAVLSGALCELTFARASMRVNSAANNDDSLLQEDSPTTLF